MCTTKDGPGAKRNAPGRKSASTSESPSKMFASAIGSHVAFRSVPIASVKKERDAELPRGSRKHLLDLLACGDVFMRIAALLGPHGLVVSTGDVHVPLGPAAPKECTLRSFTRKHLKEDFDFERFDNWWVSDRVKNPTWDLLSTCSIDGARGLLMIEAKGNESEIKFEGKSLKSDPKAESLANHERITACISEASVALGHAIGGGVNLTVTSKYQLANRVASAWKLADCGLPVALLYLGFTGDTYFDKPFLDDAHWQRAMAAYLDGTVPHSLPGRVVATKGTGSLRMLIASLKVTEISTR